MSLTQEDKAWIEKAIDNDLTKLQVKKEIKKKLELKKLNQ